MLIQEALFRTADRNKLALSYLRLDELRGLKTRPRRKTQIIEGRVCLLTSFWDSFGHWIPEHLLKIKSLSDAGVNLKSVRFVVRDPVETFRFELLASAGIAPHQIIPWKGSFAVVEELIVPNYPQISSENLLWLDSLIPRESNSVPLQRVYLSRQKQAYRNIANETEVQRILAAFDISTVFPEDLSFSEQVKIVRDANLLFGPQGSAFTLQIFMNPGATLIEAFPRDRVHLFNRQVAMVKGHRHIPLMDARGPEAKGFTDKSVMVNTGSLESALARIQRAS